MIQVWFDFPGEEDRPSITLGVEVLPRTGETVGVVELDDQGHFRLHKVVDIRHYLPADRAPEIRVLLEG